MTDAPDQPAVVWLTYQQLADRLGLRTPAAAAARARRAKWPKRTKNDTLEAEIAVPAAILAAGAQKPQEGRQAPAPTPDAPTVADAVGAALAPLVALVAAQQNAIQAKQATLDASRAETAALNLAFAQSEMERQAAEKRAQDLAMRLEHQAMRLEREERDRQTLQRQYDAKQAELHTALADVAKAQAASLAEKVVVSVKMADLERQKAAMAEALAAQKARRWWWPW